MANEMNHRHQLPVLLNWCRSTKIDRHQVDIQWIGCRPETLPRLILTLLNMFIYTNIHTYCTVIYTCSFL